MAPRQPRSSGIPWHFVSLLLAAALCFFWIGSNLALGTPSCQDELSRAIRAEDRVRGLEERVLDLERQLAAVVAAPGAAVATPSVPGQAQPLAPLPAPGAAEGAPPAVGPPITEQQLRTLAANDATAVVMITCNRPKYLQRAMESLLRAKRDPQLFPLIISQDGFDEAMTAHVQSSYVDRGIAYHMHHSHESNALQVARSYAGNQLRCGSHKADSCEQCPQGHGKSWCHGDCHWVDEQCVIKAGYVYIAQHFGFALRTVFDTFGFGHAIFIEEDMDIAPDFFGYFGAALPLLLADKDLFCVSAWNDNGLDTLVEDPKAIYRTDFFPGLGWMIASSFWAEVRDRWPGGYWDEFMRRPDVRKGRHCIRPEISRSFTFGENGTSGGQFFKRHLAKIKLNQEYVDWAQQDLKFLATAAAFDAFLSVCLQGATDVPVGDAVKQPSAGISLRVKYAEPKGYKAIAKEFNLMDDEKEGIRRMSYRGVIPFSWKGNRVYLYTEQWPGQANLLP